jgi:hypothetical protein
MRPPHFVMRGVFITAYQAAETAFDQLAAATGDIEAAMTTAFKSGLAGLRFIGCGSGCEFQGATANAAEKLVIVKLCLLCRQPGVDTGLEALSMSRFGLGFIQHKLWFVTVQQLHDAGDTAVAVLPEEVPRWNMWKAKIHPPAQAEGEDEVEGGSVREPDPSNHSV